MKNKHLRHRVVDLLCQSGIIDAHEKGKVAQGCLLQAISPDGSQRRFFRVSYKEKSLCIAVLPASAASAELAEARAVVSIGKHLYAKGVCVPEIYGSDNDSGLLLFEDCGDTRLHDSLKMMKERDERHAEKQYTDYRNLIDNLVVMQVSGTENFDPRWCCDTEVYDRKVMINRESKYFLHAFWYTLLNGSVYSAIEEEFEEIAACAGHSSEYFFLHRDFQCRNIMVVGDRFKIIDFQGGRLGPPGYDLASLLLDPYAGLSVELQERLFDDYLREFRKKAECNEIDFCRQYTYLRLQRNLQIIGAFSFLYMQRKKPFFKQYIKPALQQLSLLLEENELQRFTTLHKIVTKAQSAISHTLV